MIRFTTIYDHGDDNASHIEFQTRLRQSFARYVAYCGLVRACRSVPQVRAKLPVVIGLVLPDEADFQSYQSALNYVAHGSALFTGKEDRTDVTHVREPRKPWATDEMMETLGTYRRVFLLAGSPVCVPEAFRMAADKVIDVGPVQPSDIIAAAKVCLGIGVSPDEAEFLAAVPLPTVAAALRPGRPVKKTIATLTEAQRPKPRQADGPLLEDLHGLGEAEEWGKELATDLADWRAGKIGWADVDRGILLSGPPGTGKTTFAGALARTCGVHLVLGSIGRWQAKGHLGDLLKAMRAAFDEARKNAPSIIFLDEIDAVGDRERFSDHNAQYFTEVVAALLECIDGAEGREGVVVVGACNHPDRLDAALIRAGRLDRHVHIPLPDAKGREGILRWHLQRLLLGADLSEIAARTEGWNGASLEQLVRTARRLARRGRRDMTMEDLASGLPAAVAVPEALRGRMAIHEAGHAAVGLMLDAGEVVAASVSSSVVPTEGIQDGGGVVFATNGFRERTRSQILDDMAVRLGGLAAEEVFLGERSAGAGGAKGSDLHGATASALAFEASYGFGEGFAYLSSSDEDELFATLRLDRYLQVRVDKLLAAQFARAKKIVEDHRQEVERIAEALLAKETLSGDELRDLVAQQPRLMLVEPSPRRTG